MKMYKKLAVLAAAMTMATSSWAGFIGTTAQGGNPSGEMTKLLTLITVGEDCVLSFIAKDELTFEKVSKGGLGVEAKSYTYPNLNFLGDLSDYGTIFVGVKAATQIAWYEYPADDLPLTFSSGSINKEISHISFFGLSCPPDEPPTVPDAGSMLVMLGAGMVSLAGLRRKLRL